MYILYELFLILVFFSVISKNFKATPKLSI